MGRNLNDSPATMFSARVHEPTATQFRKAAEARGLTVSDAVRDAIFRYADESVAALLQPEDPSTKGHA